MSKDSLLVPVAAGRGGIREMQEAVDDATVQFGLVRFELGSGNLRRQKLLFLHVNGLNCPAVTRGRANEYLADAKTILDAGAEPIHASVEIKEKAEVTTESILARVSKFFITDDEANYSVKWIMDRYEQFISESSYTNARSISASEDASRKFRCPGHDSAPLFTLGRNALKSVAGPSGPWNWVFVRADPDALPLVSGGSGSVDEMRDCMKQHDDEVLFGLLRMGFGVGRLRRIKHVFVQAIGVRVAAFERGRLGTNRPRMEKALNDFALTSTALEITDPADFTVQSVIDRVRQAAVIDDNVLDPDKAGKSIFSVEHFRESLQEEMGMQGQQGEEEPWTSKGGFGDRTANEIAHLVGLPGGDFNWALFSVNMMAKKSRLTLQKSSQLRPVGSNAPCTPHGGYAAASIRARSLAPSVPPGPPVAVTTGERHTTNLVSNGFRSRLLSEGVSSQCGGRRSRVLSEGVSGHCRSRAASIDSSSSPPEEILSFNSRLRAYTVNAKLDEERFSQPRRTRLCSMESPSSPPESETLSGGPRPRAFTAAPEFKIAETTTVNGRAAPCWGVPIANAKLRLQPKPRGPRLAGALLKQSPGFLHRWQLRHFEIASGKLRWWTTLREKEDGGAPKNEVDLQGLCTQSISASSFKLQTASSNKVYVLDAGVQSWVKDDVVHDLSRWIQALQQEARTSTLLAQQGIPGVAHPAQS